MVFNGLVCAEMKISEVLKLLQQPEMNNPTLLVVTDRNDLDGQLFQTFSNAHELFK